MERDDQFSRLTKQMKNFKKIIKENLSDFFDFKRAQCDDEEGVTTCDLIGEKSQILINMGKMLKQLESGSRKFTPKDAEYMINIISMAKREFGEDNEDVSAFETSIKKMLNLSANITPAIDAGIQEKVMSDLRENFLKYKLFQIMLDSISLEFLLLILFLLFLAISVGLWYDQE